MLHNIQISVYQNALSTKAKTCRLIDFLKNEDTRAAVQAVREMQDKERRADAKKLLPAATISGIFRERNIKGIEHYNGLLCLDFDGSDNPGISADDIKTMVSEFQEIAYAGLSVSGAGVFAIMPTNNTDPADHPAIVDFMRNVFLEVGLLIDGACKDVCRLRFISYDPAAWWNPAPVVFDAKRFIQEERERQRQAVKNAVPNTSGDQVQTKVERYVSAIVAQGRDITASYQDWLRIGFALASEFGMRGEVYYHQVSQFHPKYDYLKTEKKYLELCRNGGNRVQIGTFFKLCHENGVKP